MNTCVYIYASISLKIKTDCIYNLVLDFFQLSSSFWYYAEKLLKVERFFKIILGFIFWAPWGPKRGVGDMSSAA